MLSFLAKLPVIVMPRRALKMFPWLLMLAALLMRTAAGPPQVTYPRTPTTNLAATPRGRTQNVSAAAASSAGAHNQKAGQDAAMATVGLAIFWPALLFTGGDGAQAAEVTAKGRDAIA